MAELCLKELEKRYPNGVLGLYPCTITVSDGEFLVVTGTSNSGKSTLLRMIAGLEDCSGGEICLDKKNIADQSPKERDVCLLSQNYALDNGGTVYDNLAYGLKLRKASETVIQEKVKMVANMLGLTEVLSRKPKTLTGAQRQRVALGRAIVREPKLFLLDEPLSNLDDKLRAQKRAELLKIHARLKATFVYGTRDQAEALTLGERVAVLKDGFLQQVDTPQNLYDYPVNAFVGCYFGTPAMNLLRKATLREEDGVYTVCVGENAIVLPESIVKRFQTVQAYANTGKELILGIRPEDVHATAADGSDGGALTARLEQCETADGKVYWHTVLEGSRGEDLVATGDGTAERGVLAALTLDGARIQLFDGESEYSVLSRDAGYCEDPAKKEDAEFVPLSPREMEEILNPPKAKKKK